MQSFTANVKLSGPRVENFIIGKPVSGMRAQPIMESHFLPQHAGCVPTTVSLDNLNLRHNPRGACEESSPGRIVISITRNGDCGRIRAQRLRGASMSLSRTSLGLLCPCSFRSGRHVPSAVKRAAIVVAAFLILGAVAKADSVGPTWEISATGTFNGGGASESFTLDWTVSFVTMQGFGGVFPTFSGTTSMSGVLGTFSSTFQDAMLNQADGGFLAFFSSASQAEIDITTANYYPYGFNPLTLSYVSANPPIINVPYVYSCAATAPCTAYGSGTGIGLFSGQGTIVETARDIPVATPEPGSLPLLLSSALLGIPFLRRHKANQHSANHE